MQIIATQYSTRQSPRKVRLVTDAVKGMSLPMMLRQLAVIERHSTEVVLKVLRQAIANAQHNHGLQASDLTVKSISVMEGPRYRRFQPVSRGRAHGIVKQTCHIRVTLESTTAAAPEKIAGDKETKKAKSLKKTSTVSATAEPVVLEPDAKTIQKSMAEQKSAPNVQQVPAKRLHQRRTGT